MTRHKFACANCKLVTWLPDKRQGSDILLTERKENQFDITGRQDSLCQRGVNCQTMFWLHWLASINRLVRHAILLSSILNFHKVLISKNESAK